MAIRQLGYPTKNSLKSWHHEYEIGLDLPAGYVRQARASVTHKNSDSLAFEAKLPSDAHFQSSNKLMQSRTEPLRLLRQGTRRGGRFLHQRGVLLCHLVQLRDGNFHVSDARGLLVA